MWAAWGGLPILSLASRIIRHFDLADTPGVRPLLAAEDAPAAPLPPPPKRPVPLIYTLLHYVVLVLGVVSKCFIESLNRGGRMSWVTLASSAILAAVIFPSVYKRVCDLTQVGPMQFFLSFQHGFFFQTILEEIQKALI